MIVAHLIRALKRLTLFIGAFAAVALLLEGLARVLITPPAPVRFSDGFYVSQLPLTSGRDTVAWLDSSPHPHLPLAKRPGEVRVFVFGESSVQGSPWEYPGSPPAMLYDQLHARFPARDVTVVNMGRGAAMTRDVYYFLVSIARFHPDFVVFYLGGNDQYEGDAEMCMPVAHPSLHAMFRGLVERSRLLWSARALGPFHLVRMRRGGHPSGGGTPQAARCNADAGFAAWTDLLVATAQEMGARVVVTTAPENHLRWREGQVAWASVHELRVGEKDAAYLRLLGCVLDGRCDVRAAFGRERALAIDAARSDLGTCWRDGRCRLLDALIGAVAQASFYSSPLVDTRRRIWLDAASRRGAAAIDFVDYIEKSVPGGPFAPFFTEERHLSLGGYWTLAWLWSEALSPALDGKPMPRLATKVTRPPRLDAPRYLRAVTLDARRDASCILLGCAATYLRASELLMAASLLNQAIDEDPAATSRAGIAARLARGWLRRAIGAEPGVSSALAPFIDRVGFSDLERELQEHRDCSTLGTGLLEPLLPPPPPEAVSDPQGGHPGRKDSAATATPRAEPSTEGSSLDAWLDGLLLLFVAFVIDLLRRRRRGAPPAADAGT